MTSTSFDQKRVIGENIKLARKMKGLSQRALAEKLGIAFQNLSVWENGKGAPSAKYLMKLAEILGISLDQLTSAAGIKLEAERSREQQYYGSYPGGISAEPYAPDVQKGLHYDFPRSINRELSESHTLKLIVAYLEEMLSLLKYSLPERHEIRRAADSQSFKPYAKTVLRIPLPPVDLSSDERLRWERNASTLLKWSNSMLAFWVPSWALEKYLREIEPSPFGENLEELSNVLKGYLEQGRNK